jgi:hypothetical protein
MGNMICYWKQNSSIKDFHKLLAQFAERLCRCGHETQKVTEGIEKATKYIDESLLSQSKSTKSDITRQTLRRVYDEMLAEKDGFDKKTICYSRTRNLHVALTRASLSEPKVKRVNDLIDFLDPSSIREF